ncbi:hypothetical protein ACPP3B_13575 [Tepidimonas sp. HKU77]|jgi:hypothetical protein|uniref:hypothetical protein n=1 Tax=Tepidimonas sp. HKU77 TaxID=3414503 RepID=UPI003C79B563
MLKPIHRVTCSPALAACQQLMRRFALWLCAPQVSGVSITQANLRSSMGSAIEGDWLWHLLAGKTGTKPLFDKAKRIADLSPAEKTGLQQWIQAVSALAQHFGPTPPAALPVAPPNQWRSQDEHWKAFKTLMVAFYEDGLRGGLPYAANGAPTTDVTLRVSYDQFVREFRAAHRPDPHPDAREVCVLCGGPLVQPAVDHWLAKTAFPLLAVCADNLLPICGECNSTQNKGQNPAHAGGAFSEWFHPYLRHANGAIRLRYDEATPSVRVESATLADAVKVQNLDILLNLSQRWTREFKAEYRRLQREAQRRYRGDVRALQHRIMDYRRSLSAAEPHYEIHALLAEALLDPARLQAFAE